MNTNLIAFGVCIAGLIVLFVIAPFYFAVQENGVRQWLRRRGPHDDCPRCGKAVPVGFIDARRAYFERRQQVSPVFGAAHMRFEDSWDSEYRYGGGSCAICGLDYSVDEARRKREAKEGVEPTIDNYKGAIWP